MTTRPTVRNPRSKGHSKSSPLITTVGTELTSDKYMVGKTVLAPQLSPLTNLPKMSGTTEPAGLATAMRTAARTATALLASIAPRRPNRSAKKPAERPPMRPPMAQIETTTEKRSVTAYECGGGVYCKSAY